MFTETSARRPRSKNGMTGRRLVAVDLENVASGTIGDLSTAALAWDCVDRAIGLSGQDLVVVGAGRRSALSAWQGRPSARLMRSGSDGADLALLEVLETESIERRFDQVVVVSGDGIFTEAVARLGGQGVRSRWQRVPAVCRDGCVWRPHPSSFFPNFSNPLEMSREQ